MTKGLEMMAMKKSQDREEQAASWVAGMFSGDNRVNVNPEREAWYAEDVRNAAAFDELMTVVNDLDKAGEQLLQEEWEHELAQEAEARRRQRWIAGFSTLAAGLVVAAVMTVSMWVGLPEPVSFETAKGQRSTIALADGSVLHLNTDTRITALMEDDQRHVVIERGEAFFDVKRDESRPFIVQAGQTQVRVLGTEFNVRLGASTNVVSVLSGLVSVAQRSIEDADKAYEIVQLKAGEQAEHDIAQHMAVIESFDQSTVMAWRSGKAAYHETPLALVVQDLNRYFKQPLQIADASIADLPVTGTFNVTDQNVVIDALESAFSLMAVKRVDGVILLYSRET